MTTFSTTGSAGGMVFEIYLKLSFFGIISSKGATEAFVLLKIFEIEDC
jgi:hypothetical protein